MDGGHCIAPRAPGDGSKCPHPREPGSLFCRGHEQAPAVQRGGWLSAERRRRQRLGGAEGPALDVSNIVPRLWISALPPLDRDLPGFDVMVLCMANTGDRSPFRGQVIYCPTPAVLGPYDIRSALLTARHVAAGLRTGHTVLVACATGHQGAPLVAGLGLGFCSRMTAAQIADLIRRRRSPECLTNPQHQQVLEFYLRRR